MIVVAGGTLGSDDQNSMVRRLINDSTHVLVAPLADSVAIGIEAEYAYQLKKPLAVWYPNAQIRSRMLSAIATLEREADESVDSPPYAFYQIGCR
jgi:hypothetical protein